MGWLVMVVVGLNSTLAIAGFYVAWRLWHLRGNLAQLTQLLNHTTRQLQTLPAATLSLKTGELGLVQTRLAYRRLHTQLQQIAQLIAIAQWAHRRWRSRL